MKDDTQDRNGVQVPAGTPAGAAGIPAATPHTRLHYFEGRYLRAADLEREQRYHAAMLRASNRAGGAGVVDGFDVREACDELEVSAGLAFDGDGRTLFLPVDVRVSLDALLDAATRPRRSPARPEPAPSGRFAACEPEAARRAQPEAPPSDGWWVLHASHAERPCGQLPVYGRACAPCEGATEHGDLREGVYFWLERLTLRDLPGSRERALDARHLRSRIASAYFNAEGRPDPGLVDDGVPGLLSRAWCHGAARAGGASLPLAVLARGTGADFHDGWIVRRERMETPPRRYWQRQMRMRSWAGFLAQVLQFQCQLAEGEVRVTREADDPCDDVRDALREAQALIDRLMRGGAAGGAAVGALSAEYARVRSRVEKLPAPAAADREVLLGRGFVELPPAGYLPVRRGTDAPTVNEQVRRWVGPGVDLRFCRVRPDYVAHALEEAQHLERISLIEGIDDPSRRPRVDVLVPDGEEVGVASRGPGFRTTITVFGAPAEGSLGSVRTAGQLRGAARRVKRTGGVLYVGAASGTAPWHAGTTTAEAGGMAMWGQIESSADPRTVTAGRTVAVEARASIAQPAHALLELGVRGDLTVSSREAVDGVTRVRARFEGETTTSGEAAQTGPVEVAVRVATASDGSPLVAVATARNGAGADGVLMLWEVSWAGTPRRAVATATRVQWFDPAENRSPVLWVLDHLLDAFLRDGVGALPKARTPKMAGEFVWDAAALAPEATPRGQAEQAIAVIEDVDPSARSGEAMRALLFGAERPEHFELRARHEWVMFHRRRERVCGPEETRAQPPEPPEPALDEHVVYRAEIGPVTAGFLEETRENLGKLAAGETASSLADRVMTFLGRGVSRLGVVRVERGTGNRADGSVDVAAAWEDAGDGTCGLAIGLGRPGDAARAQIWAIAQDVGASATRREVALSDVLFAKFLETYDAAGMAAGARSITVLCSLVIEDQHPLLRAIVPREDLDAIVMNALETAGPAGGGAEQFILTKLMRRVEWVKTVHYERDTANRTRPIELTAEWEARGGGKIARAVVVHRPEREAREQSRDLLQDVIDAERTAPPGVPSEPLLRGLCGVAGSELPDEVAAVTLALVEGQKPAVARRLRVVGHRLRQGVVEARAFVEDVPGSGEWMDTVKRLATWVQDQLAPGLVAAPHVVAETAWVAVDLDGAQAEFERVHRAFTAEVMGRGIAHLRGVEAQGARVVQPVSEPFWEEELTDAFVVTLVPERVR